MRVLVAIANHGTKNQAHLARLLAAYRSMSYDVDIVVLSDQPKDLGEDVEVRVGAPTQNPWSLPFAHRRVFADRCDDYDLFVYTEDDTLILEPHLEAFQEVNALLDDHEVPGFMRFERYQGGDRSFCSVHSSYRWLPETVEARGAHLFARFSNDHSACYVLTRDQLRRALRSGGYVMEPHQGEYDMLVTAATDPYTRCGLVRTVCISRIEDFLLHHLPDVYLGKLGIPEQDFKAQLSALEAIANDSIGPEALVDPHAALDTTAWDLPCYPAASDRLRSVVPAGLPRALSLGTTAGSLERELFGDETEIAAVPLDNVFGEMARRRGITMMPVDLDAAFHHLEGERFPCILIHELLAHFPDPVALLRRLRPLLAEGGLVVATAPNFDHHQLRTRLRLASDPLPERAAYHDQRLHRTGPRILDEWLDEAGYGRCQILYETRGRWRQAGRLLPSRAGRWLGHSLIATAVQSSWCSMIAECNLEQPHQSQRGNAPRRSPRA